MVTPTTRPCASSAGAPDSPDNVPSSPLVRPTSAQDSTGSSRAPRPKTFKVSRPSRRDVTSPGRPCGKPGWKARCPLRSGASTATGRAAGPPSVISKATSARGASRTSAATARPSPTTSAGLRHPSTTWRAVTQRPRPAMEKAVPDDGLNGASPASTVTASSKGVMGPSSAPSATSAPASATGGASAFSRRPRDTARNTAATAP